MTANKYDHAGADALGYAILHPNRKNASAATDALIRLDDESFEVTIKALIAAAPAAGELEPLLRELRQMVKDNPELLLLNMKETDEQQ